MQATHWLVGTAAVRVTGPSPAVPLVFLAYTSCDIEHLPEKKENSEDREIARVVRAMVEVTKLNPGSL